MTHDLPQEAKSALHKDARYETFLAAAGAFMDNMPLKIGDASRSPC